MLMNFGLTDYKLNTYNVANKENSQKWNFVFFKSFVKQFFVVDI